MTWQRTLAAGISIVGVTAAAIPALLPLASAVVALAAFLIGGRQLRMTPARVATPWRLVLAAVALNLLSVAARVFHSTATGVEHPFPSIADLFAIGSYSLMIAGGVSFVRARTAERSRSDFVDSFIVTGLVAMGLYVLVLGDLVSETDSGVWSQIVQLTYTALALGLIAVTARASFGPGARNGSYYLFATAAVLIVGQAVLTLAQAVGRSDVANISLAAASIAFTFLAAAMVHPGASRLTDRPTYEERKLSVNRLLLLLVAVAAGPILVLTPSVYEDTTHLTIVLSLWIAVSFAALFRLVLLVLDRERTTNRERALRDLARTFSLAQTADEVIAASLSVGADILQSGDLVIALYEERVDQRWLAIAARGPESESTPGQHASAADSALMATVGGATLLTREQNAADVTSHGGATGALAVAPIEGREGPRRCLVLRAGRYVGIEQAAALEALAGQLSLGLHSVASHEDLHQRRSERRFQALARSSSDVVFIIDDHGSVGFVSPTVERLLGRRAADVVGVGLKVLIHPEDQEQLRRALVAPCPPEGARWSSELRFLHTSGRELWFEVEARDFRDEDEIRGVVVTASDISDRRRAEAQLLRSEARFRLMVQNSADVVAILDQSSIITYVSPSIERMLGYTVPDVLGRDVFELLSVTEAERLRAMLSGQLDGSALDVRIQSTDGHVRVVEVVVTDMTNQPEVDGVVLNIRDISERKALEDDLRFRALHDDLTGLANRRLLIDRINTALDLQKVTVPAVAALHVDLDDFKLINDSLGHVAGDRALATVAARLQELVGGSGLVARLGGDEFGVMLNLTSVSSTGPADGPESRGPDLEARAVAMADGIRETLGSPIRLGTTEFRLSASLGIAVADTGISGEDLLRRADLAVSEAKGGGGDRHALYADDMAESAFEELELKSALVRALENDEFVLHYQPIVDLATSRIKGVEALIRWEDPDRGMVSPAAFIPVAEESGLIRPIGKWVAGRAATDLSTWRAAGHDIYCSGNVSGRQLSETGFATSFVETVVQAGADPSTIVVELTESVLATDGSTQVFDDLHRSGFRLAIDDFGTGYSALQYLQTFEIDLIKIDRSFVQALGTDDDAGVVEAVLDLAGRIGASTVAEGIEESEELEALKSLGVNLGQGYYFSRPVPVGEIIGLLESGLVDVEPALQR
ncbi:MAG: putative bifunctional diguanylate cyclase/phosphodiesterase [Acidimicrobiales bacterium]